MEDFMHSRTARGSEPAPAGWSALFEAIETRGGVLDASSEMVGPDAAGFRAMYLDLGAIRETLRSADAEPAVITICADVLNIPHRLDWRLQRAALVIVARRIQSAGYATVSLDYRDRTAASLTVFTEELEGRFQAIAVTAPNGPQPAAFIFDAAPATGGVRIHLPGRQPVETPLDSMRGLPPQATEIVEQALRTEFTFASLLHDQRPDLARAMLGWIKSCSRGLPGMAWIAAELGNPMLAQAGAVRTPSFPRRPPELAATR
ncbi:hypothetical protein KXR53_19285 [Inquilinus limosus]|uniref:hypothetical protein n=1 Tax=Inquilinus limosus TaxID=171674 RepID=UPI003F17A024